MAGAPIYDNLSFMDNGRAWVMFVPEFPVGEIPIIVSFMIAIGIIWRKKRKIKN